MSNLPAWTGTLATVALLAGCASPGPATGPTGAPLGGACNAASAQSVVGQNTTATVMEAARLRSGARMVRILRPGQITTKEFDAQRLNLEVNAAGRIVAVRCG